MSIILANYYETLPLWILAYIVYLLLFVLKVLDKAENPKLKTQKASNKHKYSSKTRTRKQVI